MNHVCDYCGTTTDSLLEHRSEVEPPKVFHAECCPGGCDEPQDHVDEFPTKSAAIRSVLDR